MIYLSQSRSVVRKAVRVWDPHPEKKLDFVWEPATGDEPGICRGRHHLRQGQAGMAGARLGELRPQDHLQRLFRRDARRPAERATAGSRSAPAKCSRATGWTACSTARASMSMPTAIATKACFRAGLPEGEGRYLARTGEIFEGELRRRG